MSNTVLRKMYKYLVYLSIVLGTVVFFLGITTYGERIEGTIRPVASRMSLAQIIEKDKQVIIYGSSNRLRNCNFIAIKWYLGTRAEGSVPVTITFDKPAVRTEGGFDFGPWTVEIPSTELFINYSYADVVHQCKTFGYTNWWHTVSPFWK